MEWAEESIIDVKYRELFAEFSFVRTDGEAIPGKPRYVFNCPFGCKQKDFKPCCCNLLWNSGSSCYVLECSNEEASSCVIGLLQFPEFLERLNSKIFGQYQWERFHEGTTGDGWNCSHPSEVQAIKGRRKIKKTLGRRCLAQYPI